MALSRSRDRDRSGGTWGGQEDAGRLGNLHPLFRAPILDQGIIAGGQVWRNGSASSWTHLKGLPVEGKNWNCGLEYGEQATVHLCSRWNWFLRVRIQLDEQQSFWGSWSPHQPSPPQYDHERWHQWHRCPWLNLQAATQSESPFGHETKGRHSLRRWGAVCSEVSHAVVTPDILDILGRGIRNQRQVARHWRQWPSSCLFPTHRWRQGSGQVIPPSNLQQYGRKRSSQIHLRQVFGALQALGSHRLGLQWLRWWRVPRGGRGRSWDGWRASCILGCWRHLKKDFLAFIQWNIWNILKPLAASAAYNWRLDAVVVCSRWSSWQWTNSPMAHSRQSCLRVQNKVISHFNCCNCKLRGRDCRTEPLLDVFRTIQIHGKPLEAPAKKGLDHALYCTGCPSHRRWVFAESTPATPVFWSRWIVSFANVQPFGSLGRWRPRALSLSGSSCLAKTGWKHMEILQ